MLKKPVLFWLAVRRLARRFFRLVVLMGLLVVSLFLVELAALRWMGVKYYSTSSWWGRAADFSISADGRRGVSRIVKIRASPRAPLQCVILLHDTRHPGYAVRSDLSRFNPRSVAVSPSGGQVAFTTSDGAIFISPVLRDTGPPRLLGRASRGWRVKPAWSPDGRYLAAVDWKHFYIWRLTTGKLLHKLPHSSRNLSLRFSPDSRWLLAGGDCGKLRRWDLASGKMISTIASPCREIGALGLSHDGRLAALSNSRGELCLYDLGRGETIWRKHRVGVQSPRIAFSPDGALVAAAGEKIWVRCVRTGEIRCTLDDYEVLSCGGVAFASDGVLYSWGDRDEIVGWSVAKGRQVWRFSYRRWEASGFPPSGAEGRQSAPRHRSL